MLFYFWTRCQLSSNNFVKKYWISKDFFCLVAIKTLRFLRCSSFIDQIPTLSNDKIITHYSQRIPRACIDIACVLYCSNDNVGIIILFYHSQHTITIWPLSVISKRNHKLIIVLFKRNHIKKTNNKWQWIWMGKKEIFTKFVKRRQNKTNTNLFIAKYNIWSRKKRSISNANENQNPWRFMMI